MKKNTCRIKALKNCSSKLAFVKHVMFTTGLGLMEAKYLTDTIFKKPYKYVEIELPMDADWQEFRQGLDELSWEGNVGANYEMDGDLRWRRNFKLLQLGAASKEEYADFILESFASNFGNSEEVLKFTLDRLSKEDLIETINLYKING